MIFFLNIYKKWKELPEIKQIPDSREVKTLKTYKNKNSTIHSSDQICKVSWKSNKICRSGLHHKVGLTDLSTKGR